MLSSAVFVVAPMTMTVVTMMGTVVVAMVVFHKVGFVVAIVTEVIMGTVKEGFVVAMGTVVEMGTVVFMVAMGSVVMPMMTMVVVVLPEVMILSLEILTYATGPNGTLLMLLVSHLAR